MLHFRSFLPTALVLLLSVIGGSLFGQSQYMFTNHTYVDHIKTVTFGPSDYPHLFPILELNGGQPLTLAFDDLESEVRNYVYTVVHCDRNWEPSGLAPLEYINGFEEENIQNYDFSFRALQNYTHYSLAFPNNNMDVTKSGNYLLVVYEDEEEKRVVITRRFVVVDRQVGISAEIVRPVEVRKIHTHQELDFEVNFLRLNVRNPMVELSATVLQNQRWDTALTGLSPKFLNADKAIFDYQGEVVFPGGNEFRLIDLRSIRIPHRDIVYIDVNMDQEMEAELAPITTRSRAPHLSFIDFNGRYLIENQDNSSSDLASEYVRTMLTYKVEQPYLEDHVYLIGDITEWQLKDEYQLRYNPAISAYVGRFPLKQGYYNYYIATAPSDADPRKPRVPSFDKTEGNHADTENDYYILLYYRPFGTRYDQIVGYVQVNTLQN